MSSIYNNPAAYDLQYADYDRDIPFMLWLAEQYAGGRPILEMACGTLRVTIPLAQAGHNVCGVDLSQRMLEHGQTKLAQLDRSIADRIMTHHGDMRTVQLPTKGTHKLAVVPFTAFLHLVGQEKQLQALANIRDHLAPGGYFLADIFNPNPNKLNKPFGFEKNVVDEQQGLELKRWNQSTYRTNNQTARWFFVCEITNLRTGEVLHAFTEEATVAIIQPDQWRSLLTESGFAIVEEWGDFDRTPFDPSIYRRMLFLCQKI